MPLAHSFVHLRVHSEYSISDGIVRFDDLIQTAHAQNMPAIGISDLMSLFGMVKFYKKCRQKGIKPIVGVDVWVEGINEADEPSRLLLIVKNRNGYQRLCELVSQAYVDNQYLGRSTLKREWITQASNQDLICLSGAHLGDVGVALLNAQIEDAKTRARFWAQAFPDSFYIELQRLSDSKTEICVQESLHLAHELDLPVVATHPIQFMQAADFKAHETRVCIATGYTLGDKRRVRQFTQDQYFVSTQEMQTKFADIPSALENTLEISKRCNLSVTLGDNFLPLFPTPDGMSLDDFLVFEAKRGLENRLALLYPDIEEREAQRTRYEDRLKFECDTIIQMGFPGYFLIVADFIRWGKKNGCPVGPGRGSGAGSLVAYVLDITDLDPLRYALLFERFLNPERVSMPDFDIDFCQENRWRVIEYVRNKYGVQAVSQIATFGTMSSKSVIRDVGRALDLPFGLCDKLSKLIPLEANKPLPLLKAMEVEPQIKEIIEAEGAEELLELACKLEDLTRGLGMHAGGVLIAPGKLTDFCPLYVGSADGSAAVSQFDKDDVEQIGLVKFDFLGLRNLTIIELAKHYIEKICGDQINIETLPLDDSAAYKIFASGNTTGVFQFESTGMKRMLVQAKPSKFEEIIAFVALYRPGPMDLIPDFIERMHGTKFEYLHPLLEPVLEPTYGIMVYQEQVMQAAQVCAGYSLGGADLLRRAMGKKKVEEMVAQRAMFVEGAASKDIPAVKANEIFDYMEKFAGYGFNKSHAAAYALIAYHTAWLKAHYPSSYVAATMSTELSDTDQLKVFYDDASDSRNKLVFLAPDVNHSQYRFVPVDNKTIRYALGALKGTGEAAIEHLIQERTQNGPFKDLFDFCLRTDKRIVNRRTTEALIKAGAFDSLHRNRAELMANLDFALEAALQAQNSAHQGGLFDAFDDNPLPQIMLKPCAAWKLSKELAEEKSVMGFYFSAHPFEPYTQDLKTFIKQGLNRLSPRREPQLIAGFVTSIQTKISPRGKMAFIDLEDTHATVRVSLFSDVYDLYRDKLKEDVVLVIEAKISEDTYSGAGALRINAEKLYELGEARSRYARALNIKLPYDADIAILNQILLTYTHAELGSPIRIELETPKAKGVLQLPKHRGVTLNDELLEQLETLYGKSSVKVMW